LVQVEPDLSHEQHQAYYREHLRHYAAMSPPLAALTEATVMDLLAACDRQLKYQCSIMLNTVGFQVSGSRL